MFFFFWCTRSTGSQQRQQGGAGIQERQDRKRGAGKALGIAERLTPSLAKQVQKKVLVGLAQIPKLLEMATAIWK